MRHFNAHNSICSLSSLSAVIRPSGGSDQMSVCMFKIKTIRVFIFWDQIEQKRAIKALSGIAYLMNYECAVNLNSKLQLPN